MVNSGLMEYYNKMLEIFSEQDKGVSISAFLEFKFYNIISHMKYYAKTEEEKKFVRDSEILMIPYYQKSLEHNYELLKLLKDTSNENMPNVEQLLLTVDEFGYPKKTKVIDVIDGKPVYGDNCKSISISSEYRRATDARHKLNKYIDRWEGLEGTLRIALELKKKSNLGMEDPLTPNYDTSGMTREQADAQAWENYAIVHGMGRRTNYDDELDDLIESIEKCIDFYKKATSIV